MKPTPNIPSLLSVCQALRILSPELTRAELFTLIGKRASGPGPVYSYWYGTGTPKCPVLAWDLRTPSERIAALRKAYQMLSPNVAMETLVAQVDAVIASVKASLEVF